MSTPISDARPPVRKLQSDTAEGCRDLAAASLAEAALSVVPNLRGRLENSGATWAARATLLERLDAKRGKRTA